jgi:hypothetical protein
MLPSPHQLRAPMLSGLTGPALGKRHAGIRRKLAIRWTEARSSAVFFQPSRRMPPQQGNATARSPAMGTMLGQVSPWGIRQRKVRIYAVDDGR